MITLQETLGIRNLVNFLFVEYMDLYQQLIYIQDVIKKIQEKSFLVYNGFNETQKTKIYLEIESLLEERNKIIDKEKEICDKIKNQIHSCVSEYHYALHEDLINTKQQINAYLSDQESTFWDFDFKAFVSTYEKEIFDVCINFIEEYFKKIFPGINTSLATMVLHGSIMSYHYNKTWQLWQSFNCHKHPELPMILETKLYTFQQSEETQFKLQQKLDININEMSEKYKNKFLPDILQKVEKTVLNFETNMKNNMIKTMKFMKKELKYLDELVTLTSLKSIVNWENWQLLEKVEMLQQHEPLLRQLLLQKVEEIVQNSAETQKKIEDLNKLLEKNDPIIQKIKNNAKKNVSEKLSAENANTVISYVSNLKTRKKLNNVLKKRVMQKKQIIPAIQLLDKIMQHPKKPKTYVSPCNNNRYMEDDYMLEEREKVLMQAIKKIKISKDARTMIEQIEAKESITDALEDVKMMRNTIKYIDKKMSKNKNKIENKNEIQEINALLALLNKKKVNKLNLKKTKNHGQKKHNTK